MRLRVESKSFHKSFVNNCTKSKGVTKKEISTKKKTVQAMNNCFFSVYASLNIVTLIISEISGQLIYPMFHSLV